MHTMTSTVPGWFALDAITTYRAPVVCPTCLGSGCELCANTGEDQWTRQ